MKNDRLARQGSELTLRAGMIAWLAKRAAVQRGHLIGADDELTGVSRCDHLSFGLRQAQGKRSGRFAEGRGFINIRRNRNKRNF
jgi:hypothetical protein